MKLLTSVPEKKAGEGYFHFSAGIPCKRRLYGSG